MDWFDYKNDTDKDVLVVGNPPFGLRNKLSKAFIQHAIGFADTIAMILPEVFEKHTMQKIFPKEWRLKEVHEIGNNAFTIDGEEYHVPCKFFIFDKSEGENLMFDVSLYKECDDFCYTTKEDADLFIMGAGCKVKEPNEVTSNNRGYYLKSNIDKKELIEKLSSVDWNGKSSANGGVWWITKPELIKSYKDAHETSN